MGRTPGKKQGIITRQDRIKILEWYTAGDVSTREMAARIGVDISTVLDELQRGYTGTLDANQRKGYDPHLSDQLSTAGKKRRGVSRVIKEHVIKPGDTESHGRK
jgi:transposase